METVTIELECSSWLRVHGCMGRGGYRNFGRGGGGGGFDMNNQQGEGAGGGCVHGSIWGSRTCALDDTLYRVGCC